MIQYSEVTRFADMPQADEQSRTSAHILLEKSATALKLFYNSVSWSLLEKVIMHKQRPV